MIQELSRQFVLQRQINLPGQQELIHRVHQLQAIGMGDGLTHQTKIHIGSIAMAAHRPGTKQHHRLNP